MPEYIFRCDNCETHFSITCSMSEYSEKQYVRCPQCKKKGTRDLSFDNVTGSVVLSLSECRNIGHYAEKQTSKYGKNQVEDLRRKFKTERVSSHEELPKGMSRMDKSSGGTEWTRDEKKKRPSRRKKK